jgi:hypothetical protein
VWWCRVPHPPAGATTLIVSLGILREPWQLGVPMLAVAGTLSSVGSAGTGTSRRREHAGPSDAGASACGPA